MISKLLGVSYVPYDPDVYPPEPAADASTRPKRSLKWPVGIVLYLLAIFAWVVWMKMPARINPPLAKVDLGGGTELRLVHVHAGTNPGFRNNETFDGRIRMDPMNGRFRHGEEYPGLWLVFSSFYPEHEDFVAPPISGARIVEPDSPYPLKAGKIIDGNSLFSIVYFPVVPRRLSTLDVEIATRGQVVRVTVPNPVPQNPAAEVGKPLPQQAAIKGGTITLESLKMEYSAESDFSRPLWIASPRFRFDVPGVPKGAYSTRHLWCDNTGNVAGTNILPFSEPVWQLHVDVQQTSSFPFRPDQIDDLGTLAVPAPGEIKVLKVSPRLAKQGIKNIVAFGQGDYDVSGGSVREVKRAKGKSIVGASLGKAVVLVPPVRSFQFQLSDWAIYHFGRVESGEKGVQKFQVRVRKGEQWLTPTSSGSNASNYVRDFHLGVFRTPDSSAAVLPGEEVSVVAVHPETETVTFKLPRPSAESFPKPGSEAGSKKK